MYDVRALANWVLDEGARRGVSISNMSLNKIVYFVVENALIDRGELLTDAKIEAWEHGPVFRELYHEFKKFGDGPIASRAMKFDINSRCMVVASQEFDPQDETLFHSVLDDYIHLSASHLRALSHRQGGPWDRVWWHEGTINPGMEISAEVILAAHTSENVQ